MNEIDRHEIDELLSCYIDGELSQRQATEVKRLILHDTEVAEKFEQMEKQKLLLNALPVSNAPADLTDQIKGFIERKMILGDYSKQSDYTEGARQLFMRRVLTAAAMWILPVGILAWVVFSIIMPADNTKNTMVTTNIRPSKSSDLSPVWQVNYDMAKGDMADSSFVAALQLNTDQSIAISAFVEKLIYEKGLIDCTIPKRRAGLSFYEMTCDMALVTDLVKDLETIWPKCDSVYMRVYQEDAEESIEIADASLTQVISVFEQNSVPDRIRLAKDFAHFNSMTTQVPGMDVLAADDTAKDDIPELAPVKPVLTSGQESTSSTKTVSGETVSLTITVSGL